MIVAFRSDWFPAGRGSEWTGIVGRRHLPPALLVAVPVSSIIATLTRKIPGVSKVL
jgi:hypothetical protein